MASYFERYASQSTTAGAQGVPVVEVTVAAWSGDPLDFHHVSTEAEAVFRLNTAGFFIHTSTGEIYKKEPGGEIHLWRNFDFFFANRRCGNQNVTAGTAWKRSDRRCEYHSMGYWPEHHDRPPGSYNLWRGWGMEPIPGD